MLKLKGKNARDIYSASFGTGGCLRSSLEVLKTDRTFWILLLTRAKTEMNDVQILRIGCHLQRFSILIRCWLFAAKTQEISPSKCHMLYQNIKFCVQK